MDGSTTKASTPGADYYLNDESCTQANALLFEARCLLELEGDLTVIWAKTYMGTMYGYYSSRASLKHCAKRLLAEIFGIKNSSAIRNLKDNGISIRMPFLVDGRAACIHGAKYQYIKTHRDQFPDVDLSQIEMIKSFTEQVEGTLAEGECAIVQENYQYPDSNMVYTYGNDKEMCKDAFEFLCKQLEQGVSEYPGSRIEYSHSSEVSPKSYQGITVLTYAEEACTARFTMIIKNVA